jgi:hypothetical protein
MYASVNDNPSVKSAPLQIFCLDGWKEYLQAYTILHVTLHAEFVCRDCEYIHAFKYVALAYFLLTISQFEFEKVFLMRHSLNLI